MSQVLLTLRASLLRSSRLQAEVQVRAAEELAMLPDGSAVVEMMADYAVVRNQTRVCKSN